MLLEVLIRCGWIRGERQSETPATRKGEAIHLQSTKTFR